MVLAAALSVTPGLLNAQVDFKLFNRKRQSNPSVPTSPLVMQ